MNFLKTLAAALLVTGLGASAHATSVTVGSFTFDDSAFVDTASVAQGSISNVGNIIGGNFLTTTVPGSGDVLQFGFTDNTLGNDAGIDLLVFEEYSAVENSSIGLSLGGSSIAGVFQQSTSVSGRQVNIFGYDLSNLGVADGAQVLGDLFLTRIGSSPDLAAIAAINSGVAPVPVPAGLPLLLGGIGAFAWVRRRKARA